MATPGRVAKSQRLVGLLELKLPPEPHRHQLVKVVPATPEHSDIYGQEREPAIFHVFNSGQCRDSDGNIGITTEPQIQIGPGISGTKIDLRKPSNLRPLDGNRYYRQVTRQHHNLQITKEDSFQAQAAGNGYS